MPRSRRGSRSAAACWRACAAARDEAPGSPTTLARKVASTVGLTELVLVRRTQDGAVPLAAKYLPLTAFAHADGWILVPAASEGYPAGATVMVRALP